MQIIINGCYWGNQEQNYLWVSCLERLYVRNFNGYVPWLKLSHYPGLLLFYAGGLAAVAAGKYDTSLLCVNEVGYRASTVWNW